MTNEENNIEALHIHIEGLQAVLTRRNARIASLEDQVAQLKANPAASAAEKKSYKQGWQDCASHLQNSVKTLARELREVDKTAFRLFLDGEHKGETDVN